MYYYCSHNRIFKENCVGIWIWIFFWEQFLKKKIKIKVKQIHIAWYLNKGKGIYIVETYNLFYSRESNEFRFALHGYKLIKNPHSVEISVADHVFL